MKTNVSNVLYFYYDSNGAPIAIESNGNFYYYVTNLQGDVIAILNDFGTCVVEYEYDAWGNCTIIRDTNTIAYINPIRYRGYYYDSDTDLYYLQSRYYDANTGRFINADEPEMILQGVYNLFGYCYSNPVMGVDYSGHATRFIYSRNSARSYAEKWSHSRNPLYYSYRVGDCANFVSQCLYAGGIVMTEQWHSYRYNNNLTWLSFLPNNTRYNWDVSSAWSLVRNHYDYFNKHKNTWAKLTIRKKHHYQLY